MTLPTMAGILSATPQIFIGISNLLEDPGRLHKRGISRALQVDLSAGTDGQPCERPSPLLAGEPVYHLSNSGDALATASSLAGAARRLEGILQSAPGILPANDTEVGDSTDDEDDRAQGKRFRVRVSRPANGKWGIKWHKGIFKQSNRLVVEEVAHSSVLAGWNERQPHNAQVGYGDRLIRINGVSTEGASASQISARMKAELLKEDMRAVFFRPGAEVKGTTPDSHKSPGGVLICSDGEDLEPLAAIAAAHHLLYRVYVNECDANAALEEMLEAAQVLKEDAARKWIDALDLVRKAPGPEVSQEVPSCSPGSTAVEVDQSCNSLQGPAPDTNASKIVDEHGALSEKSAEDSAKASEQPEIQTEIAQTDDNAADEQSKTPTPSWVYQCRKCGTPLFTDLNLQTHFVDGLQKPSRDWEDAEAAQAGETPCTSLFLEPMKWMACENQQTGKLLCGSSRCKQKLGAFSWHGLPCNCGQWQSPAFQIHAARLDCMPAVARKNPAPKTAFDSC